MDPAVEERIVAEHATGRTLAPIAAGLNDDQTVVSGRAGRFLSKFDPGRSGAAPTLLVLSCTAKRDSLIVPLSVAPGPLHEDLDAVLPCVP